MSELEIGDMVLANNEKTGEIGYYPITATWLHNDSVIVYLTIDGEMIETTPKHPFYTDEGEWVAAGWLEIGDQKSGCFMLSRRINTVFAGNLIQDERRSLKENLCYQKGHVEERRSFF